MVSTAKKNKKRKAQREAVRIKHEMDPPLSGDEEDTEIAFQPIIRPETDPPRADPTQDSTGVTGFSCFLFGDTIWGSNGHEQEAEQRDQFGLLGQQQDQNGV